MAISIYWFRNDLRLADNPALLDACAASDRLVLVYVRSPDEVRATRWGFPRWGAHRRQFRDQALDGLRAAIARKGGELRVIDGQPEQEIPALARQIGADRVFCETIAAPDPSLLPFRISGLPEVYTAFRLAVERAELTVQQPFAAPTAMPPSLPQPSGSFADIETPVVPASLPFGDASFHGAETAALAHLERYFGSAAPQTYKATRNGLTGAGYSTKLSLWLAVGALSPRTVLQHLKAHEARFGANDSTYWIWFELLWRDFFRFWSLKHGTQLFHARGLGRLPPPGHDPPAFARWCAGRTGHDFVDAGMRDLAATGYLSNRMRQVVASYLVHDLACDWRAGAAWFESRLIDYDVCSNQGNWLYIAGRGTDPRQGRRFNPDKQAADYDPDGAYRALWRDAGSVRAA